MRSGWEEEEEGKIIGTYDMEQNNNNSKLGLGISQGCNIRP